MAWKYVWVRMVLNNKLVNAFDDSTTSDQLRQLVDHSVVIEGSDGFYKNQDNISKDVCGENSIYEWKVQGKSPLLILSERHAESILEITGMPLAKTHMQYPTSKFDDARAGENALCITRERLPNIVMMNKERVLEVIDPLSRHEKERKDVIEKVQSFMNDRNLSSRDMVGILNDMEKLYPASDFPNLTDD